MFFRASVAYSPVISGTPVLSVTSVPQKLALQTEEFNDAFKAHLQPVTDILHPVERLRILKFPETRLIQYDCGMVFVVFL